ncbi:MAG: DUF3592 domain-containing protein [Verrucomicrobiota bacterium]|jgi:hypothetical protein
MSKSTVSIILVTLLCWTAMVAGADYFVFGTTLRQYRSQNFAAARCQILSSEVRQQGMLHAGVSIAYSYIVNGKDYRGSRYRYDDQYSSSPGGDIVQSFPKWSEHTVYYDPNNPANSVLATGIEGSDLMLMLFSIPVNVAVIMLWTWIARWLREKWRVPEAGGVRIWRQGGKIRVRLAWLSASAAGFYALGAVSFAATFPVVAIHGLALSLNAMENTWTAVLTVAAAAFCWTALRNASGKYDLLIDEQSQALTLPQTGGRRQSITFPRGEIAGVCVQRRVSRLSSGTFYSYLPALDHRKPGAALRREALSPCGWTEEKARAFSQWLVGQLGLEFMGIQEEIPRPEPQPQV